MRTLWYTSPADQRNLFFLFCLFFPSARNFKSCACSYHLIINPVRQPTHKIHAALHGGTSSNPVSSRAAVFINRLWRYA